MRTLAECSRIEALEDTIAPRPAAGAIGRTPARSGNVQPRVSIHSRAHWFECPRASSSLSK